MNLLQNNLFEKRAAIGFWAILAKAFNKNPKKQITNIKK